MRNEGFDVNIWLDRQTGFVHGGNEWNCGTWMDKMGSGSSNKGIPATPRDGAPIELVAMQYSVLIFMKELSEMNLIPYHGVNITIEGSPTPSFWTYEEWADKIKDNFERCFWVPTDKSVDS